MINKPGLVLKIKLSLLLCFFAVQAISQSNDFGIWTSLTLKKKLTQNVSIHFQEAVRFKENSSQLGTLLSDMGIDYKFSKKFKASVNYRFSQKRDVMVFMSNRHRFYADLEFRQKISPLILTYRTRYQSQVKDYYTSENGKTAANTWRNKFELQLDLNKRFIPYAGIEFYHSLRFENNRSSRVRFKAGTQYEINVRNSVELFYLIQKEQNTSNPETDFVLGINYGISF